eukprot:TRINITY_DN12432_c0_g1_i1.p1 TRINITY_DN12432_c0_g1~~TRINITY_DN12432_c0_g1_i1.p1  ORF type:complete len:166 (-),score=5.62 TRINITY_DN12432_c0_g1_i1:24-521(-)
MYPVFLLLSNPAYAFLTIPVLFILYGEYCHISHYNSIKDLKYPSWFPFSNKIFFWAWTLLYILIGLSASLLYQTNGFNDKTAWGIFATQMILNFLWPYFAFFKLDLITSYYVCVAMVGFIAMNVVSFWSINIWSAVLLVPYLLWVIFATFLNEGIIEVNGLRKRS